MLTSANSAPRKGKKYTTAKTVTQLAVYCTINKDKLTGRTLRDIGGEVRKQFSGLVISDRSILLACESAGVVITRKIRQSRNQNHNRRSSSRALAAVVVRLAAAVEKAIGANAGDLLSADDMELLAKIRGGRATDDETDSQS